MSCLVSWLSRLRACGPCLWFSSALYAPSLLHWTISIVVLIAATGGEIDDAERQAAAELNAALTRARHARVKREGVVDGAQRVAEALAAQVRPMADDDKNEGIVFSVMSEFVRTVGTASGEKESRKARQDAERQEEEEEEKRASKPALDEDKEDGEAMDQDRGGWQEAALEVCHATIVLVTSTN
jgi:hypothetical protein